MKRILFIVLLSVSMAASFSSSIQAKIFLKEYSYHASGADSKITARSIALNQVKKALLEEITGYIKSTFDNISKEKKTMFEQLTQHQIASIIAGITEKKIIDEKWDGLTYYMKAEITVDIDNVKKKILEVAKNSEKTRELEEVKKESDDAFKQIELLQSKLARIEDKNEKMKLQKDYQNRSNELTAVDWFQMGYNSLNSNEYDLAILYYQKGISISSGNAEAYCNMGYIYFCSENYDKSIELYERAINIKPSFADAYSGLGFAYGGKGDYDKAIEMYRKAIHFKPDFADAYSGLSSAYFSKGSYDKGIEICEKEISINPKDVESYIDMGLGYDHKGNYGKAIKLYEKAISIDPENARAYSRMGFSYGNEGNREKMIICLKKAAGLGHKETQEFLYKQKIDW